MYLLIGLLHCEFVLTGSVDLLDQSGDVVSQKR